MKLKKYLYIYSLLLTCLMASCKDELDFSEFGDGESLIEATLEFKPNITNIGSRTSGTAIQSINDLYIVVYNADEQNTFNQLIHFSKTDLKDLTSTTTDKPSDYPQGDDVKSDVETAKVSCSIRLPYGRYYMYAVANLGKNLSETDVETVEKLKNISCDWNFTDIGQNAQMFGYFTNTNGDSGDQSTEDTAFGTTDPFIVINKKSVQLHSWVKRLASKVTVAFDGSGLKNNIYVYIHNVSIRQIPLSCKLGVNNTPDAEDQVTSAYFDESTPQDRSEQVLFYNSKGYTSDYSEYNPETIDRQQAQSKWLMVANGTGVLGSKDHLPTDPALFFYENMQGDFYQKYKDGHLTQEQLHSYDKQMHRDEVGTNIAPGDPDYRDNVPYGTFIEVEGYYYCGEAPINYGPIRYRFMLGQDVEYNYDAIRNHHYKVTLGFRGYANEPDWHIEYKTDPPVVFTPEVYIPYTYNTSVDFPITFKGELTGLTAEIIENNWAPYDENEPDEVPAKDSYGKTDFNDRVLEFAWYRSVFMNENKKDKPGYKETVGYYDMSKTYSFARATDNTSDNFLYGRHKSSYCHLDDKGNEDPTKPYYVTPIWAGFLRLMQPSDYNNSGTDIPSRLLPNDTGSEVNQSYYSNGVLKDFRDYYLGKMTADSRGSAANTTPLWKRTFTRQELQSERNFGDGRNDFDVKIGPDVDGNKLTTVTMKLWTQPKSMCGISGFSGNNPYEDYNRKAVIRFTATFNSSDGPVIKKIDVPVLQAKRLVNPKAVWRRHDNPEDFHVTMMERDLTDPTRVKFSAVESRGDWRASIVAGNGINGNGKKFISLVAENGSVQDGDAIKGKSPSNITFKIHFLGKLDYTDSECAQIRITYHGNTCVHNIFVRQGYHEPLKISEDNDSIVAPYWSSYNVWSYDKSTANNTQTGEIETTFTRSPLAFGAFFKRGNYAQGISVSNISEPNKGPLQAPGVNTTFALTGTNPGDPQKWSDIYGNTDINWNNTTDKWHWANSSVTLSYTDKNGEEKETTRKYRVPTITEFNTLTQKECDFGVGVLYGDGSTEPGKTTTDAFGFLDSNNTITQLGVGNAPKGPLGMRGFICYNSHNAKQIFFPIGTSGIGRRTTQDVADAAARGVLRYSSVRVKLNNGEVYGSNWPITNALRPIPMNMENAPGSIYWPYQSATNEGGWEMNYFDLNFNAVTHNFVSGTGTPRGDGGDALPIRLVLIGKPSDYTN